MATVTATVFMNNKSQAIRIPKIAEKVAQNLSVSTLEQSKHMVMLAIAKVSNE